MCTKYIILHTDFPTEQFSLGWLSEWHALKRAKRERREISVDHKNRNQETKRGTCPPKKGNNPTLPYTYTHILFECVGLRMWTQDAMLSNRCEKWTKHELVWSSMYSFSFFQWFSSGPPMLHPRSIGRSMRWNCRTYVLRTSVSMKSCAAYVVKCNTKCRTIHCLTVPPICVWQPHIQSQTRHMWQPQDKLTFHATSMDATRRKGHMGIKYDKVACTCLDRPIWCHQNSFVLTDCQCRHLPLRWSMATTKTLWLKWSSMVPVAFQRFFDTESCLSWTVT